MPYRNHTQRTKGGVMDKPQINHAELREERDYLERLIKAAGSWGAAVSVMQERVDGINRTLAGHVK